MRSTLIIPFLLLATLSASAQPLSPTISPQLSEIHDIITRGASEVIAVASDGILLRSFDNGRSWGISGAPDRTEARLYVDSAGSLFIATERALYAESGGGEGWVVIHDTPIDRFVASPDGSLWILEETSRDLLRMNPATSRSWQPVAGIDGPVRDLDITPDSTVWVAVGRRIYRSTSDAAFRLHGMPLSYEATKYEHRPDTIERLLPRPSGEILALARSGALFSHRDSASWERRLSTRLFEYGVNEARQSRDGGISVYLPNFMRVSGDGMHSLDMVYSFGSNRSIDVFAANDTFEFGGGRMWTGPYDRNGRWTSVILRRSRSAENHSRRTWTTSFATALPWGALAIVSFDSATIYAYYPGYSESDNDLSLPLELRRTNDGKGRYWTTIRGGEVDRNFLPSIDGLATWRHWRTLAVSQDHGRTWDTIPKPSDLYLYDPIHQLDTGRLLMQCRDTGSRFSSYCLVSINDNTWSKRGRFSYRDYGRLSRTWLMPDGTVVGAIRIGLFVSHDTALVVSRDTGRTWHRVVDSLTTGSEVYTIVVGAGAANVALTYDGRAYVDVGGTAPWRQAPATLQPDVSIEAADARDGVIYVGRSDGTIHRSSDNGTTWTILAALPHHADRPAALTASHHGTLYIATRLGYLYTLAIPTSTSDGQVVKRSEQLD